MANQKLNLNTLKSEIDSRKKNKNQESFGNAASAPKDAFLNGLLESLQTGRQTGASVKMVSVARQADGLEKYKKGKIDGKQLDSIKTVVEQRMPVENKHQTQVPVNNNNPSILMGDDNDRDEALFRSFTHGKSKTLAESIDAVNINAPRYNSNQPSSQPIGLNEGLLVENVKNIVNGYLSENLGYVFEEAIKNTIIEMYAVERIKEVLDGNKEMFKSIIYETLREIQEKNKAKLAKQQAQ